jgi:hypothetical protein
MVGYLTAFYQWIWTGSKVTAFLLSNCVDNWQLFVCPVEEQFIAQPGTTVTKLTFRAKHNLRRYILCKLSLFGTLQGHVGSLLDRQNDITENQTRRYMTAETVFLLLEQHN